MQFTLSGAEGLHPDFLANAKKKFKLQIPIDYVIEKRIAKIESPLELSF